MVTFLFDQAIARADLLKFFAKERARLQDFGNQVNQTFEAYVFTSCIRWYMRQGWTAQIVNPGAGRTKGQFRLKFSTRGAPANFTFVRVSHRGKVAQIRHQLRVTTASQKARPTKYANICCDVAVIQDLDLTRYKTFHAVPNDSLITFAEAKHMSAYAELVAGFVGMVFELTPSKLRRIRTKTQKPTNHISPFLYVSGILYATAQGILETIRNRKFDIDIYSNDDPLT